MSCRIIAYLSCLFLSLAAVGTSATTLKQQRRYYDEAAAGLARKDDSAYLAYRTALQSYPLEPYLAYTDLSNRLDKADSSEVERFLSRNGDLPQINWLKLRWLKTLAKREQWSLFAKYYDPELHFTELDCLHAQNLFASGRQKEASQLTQKLWLVGKSQPTACDKPFIYWKASGGMTQDMIWQRAKLAAVSGQYELASRLGKSTPSLQTSVQRLVEVAQNPRRLNNTGLFQAATPTMADTVSIGLRRLARQEPDMALSLAQYYADRMPFSNQEKLAIAKDIGLTLARRFDQRALAIMGRFDPQMKDDDISEWKVRLLLRSGQWAQAYQQIQKMPQSLAATPRWRYWKARTWQLANPQDGNAVAQYRNVTGERDFYGFLAVERAGGRYNLTNKPMNLSKATINNVRDTPAIRRALELYARGKEIEARREWYNALPRFTREQQVAQARTAYDMRWYFPAIRAISQARYWDDLDVRFPVAYKDVLVKAARQNQLPASLIFAITRQESAFMADARSPAGATGLMQLMPATAKEIAGRAGIPYSSPASLVLPGTNAALGSAYLRHLSERFNGNRILASACYNAGPGRVRQWLRGANHLEFDVWIETIPFNETRQYVLNVLAYAVIYSHKLGTPQRLIQENERFFDDV